MAEVATVETRVLTAITKFFAEIGHVTEKPVKADADLFEDLECDSLDHVEIVMALEDEFGIEISDDAAADCHKPADFVKVIEAMAAQVA